MKAGLGSCSQGIPHTAECQALSRRSINVYGAKLEQGCTKSPQTQASCHLGAYGCVCARMAAHEEGTSGCRSVCEPSYAFVACACGVTGLRWCLAGTAPMNWSLVPLGSLYSPQ